MGDGVIEERYTWDIFCCWFYFITEVESLDMGCNWKYPSWYHDWYCFGYTLYFSIWSSILILIQCTLLCFCLLISISLCQSNIVFELIYYCNWIFQCVYFLVLLLKIQDMMIYICLCLFDFICIVAMISYWTLFLIQISNVRY